MNEAIKELEHIEEWLNGLGEGWNYFGDVDRAKQRLKNTMTILKDAIKKERQELDDMYGLGWKHGTLNVKKKLNL